MDREKLNRAHRFVDGMAEESKPKKKVSLPKWLIQGLIYGMILAMVLSVVGTMAVGAFPALFAATLPIQMGAIGFAGSIGIAYTNDVMG